MSHITEDHKRNWWILLLRGIAAIVFGVSAFVFPGVTILALTLILGLWIIADGVVEIGYAFATQRWWRILLGIFGMAVGIYAMTAPQLGAYLLIFSIAGWMLVHGVLDIAEAIKLRNELSYEWVLILGGLVSIVLGVTLMVFPEAGGNVIIAILGVYAFMYGGLTIVDAFRTRSEDRSFTKVSHHGHPA